MNSRMDNREKKSQSGKNGKVIMALLLGTAMLLGGCAQVTDMNAGYGSNTGQDVLEDSQTVLQAAGQVTSLDVSDMFSSRDKEIGYDESECIRITLDGDTARTDSDKVQTEGNKVIISSEGCYLLSGSLKGQIVIAAQDTDKIQLVLDGASVSCESSAALYVSQADKVFVITAADSENLFETTGEYVAIDEHNIGGAVFARDDITFNGEGLLRVKSAAGSGIVCKDDLVITGGTYEITAGKHGLEGKDSVRIANGDISVAAEQDGIHSGNDEDDTVGYTYIAGGNITLAVQDDGIHSDTQLVIAGGNILVSESYEGLEGMSVEITGGEISVCAKDDGLNAAGGNGESDIDAGAGRDGLDGGRGDFGENPLAANEADFIRISGGKITVDAGGDGLDSNGDFQMSGGELVIYGPEDGANGALDYNGNAAVTGGTVIALGASQMAQNFGQNSSQCSIMVNTRSMQEAGTAVELRDASGTVLLSCIAKKSYNSAVLSCPELSVGQIYMVVMGEETTEVELTETIYGDGMGFGRPGESGGFGMPDGERPQMPQMSDREMPQPPENN